jgi:hypothetical protein
MHLQREIGKLESAVYLEHSEHLKFGNVIFKAASHDWATNAFERASGSNRRGVRNCRMHSFSARQQRNDEGTTVARTNGNTTSSTAGANASSTGEASDANAASHQREKGTQQATKKRTQQ